MASLDRILVVRAPFMPEQGPRRERTAKQLLALFDQGAQHGAIMENPRDIRRYALYGEKNQTIAAEFVHIETISARSSQYAWTISPHAHPGIFQILVLDAGRGEMLGDANRAALAPFSVVMVPSGCVHAFRFAEGAQGWVLSVADALLHDPRLAPFVADEVFAARAVRVAHCAKDDPSAARLVWLLADLAAGGNTGAAQIRRPALMAQLGLIVALAAEMLAQEAPAAPQTSGHDALVARFRRAVEEHYTQGWSITRYAQTLATTQPTLTRATRSVLGLSPGEVVQERLLLEAMRLLTYTSNSVGQIAERLGFGDPAYFARFFKSRTGVTASHFRARKQWLAQEPPLLPPAI